jgi:hypothetical protein
MIDGLAAGVEASSVRHPNHLKLALASRKQRNYLDYIIDGLPLVEYLRSRKDEPIDFIPPFGWLTEASPQAEAKAAARLLLRAEPDLPSGRHSLLVCPECADLGCGAVTAEIEREGDLFIWRAFGFETDYGGRAVLESFAHVREFAFTRREYSGVFRRFLTS